MPINGDCPRRPIAWHQHPSILAFRSLFECRMCYTPFALDTSVVVVRSLWLST
jgi:hypothetical protein